MVDNVILKETADYKLGIYPDSETYMGGFYGVINKDTNVLEFSSKVFPEANQFMKSAQTYWDKEVKGEKEVKLAMPLHHS